MTVLAGIVLMAVLVYITRPGGPCDPLAKGDRR